MNRCSSGQLATEIIFYVIFRAVRSPLRSDVFALSASEISQTVASATYMWVQQMLEIRRRGLNDSLPAKGIRTPDPLLAKSTPSVRYRLWRRLDQFAGPMQCAYIRARWCQSWVSYTPAARRHFTVKPQLPSREMASCSQASYRREAALLGLSLHQQSQSRNEHN